MNIYIRTNLETDLNFITNSILKSARKNKQFSDISNSVYFNHLETIIKKRLNNSQCLVACNHEDAWQVFGYIIFRRIENVVIIDYIYVKELYRDLDISKALINALQIKENDIVYNTILAENVKAKHLAKSVKAIYDPFLLTN